MSQSSTTDASTLHAVLEAECANQLRMDQGQLDQFEEQLDRLDRKFESP